MKNTTQIRSFFLAFIIFCSTSTSLAQTKNIGIVFDADTNLICQHIGLTIFNNSLNPLELNLPIREHIEQKLIADLSEKYTVSVCELPDSLKDTKLGVLDIMGIGKKLTKWASTKKDEYDIIIFVRNGNILPEYNVNAPSRTSGIYSRPRRMFLHCDIMFHAYRASTGSLISYNFSKVQKLHKLKDLKKPKDKKTFSPEELEFITAEFTQMLNNKIDYFTSEVHLLPKVK